jgi:hypothetical protein
LKAKLKIAVLFPRDYELANLEVYAEIIWKDVGKMSMLMGTNRRRDINTD